ncbi:hypothetical protein ACF1G0_31465 [Streptomyces sp. NPDC013953]|uniref:hypothetical protein n=1 Tax=Streptomyces sp. NPDC013953 TaxID=3364868 RepID=UPI0036FC1904
MDGVAGKDWRAAVVDDEGKVERIPYELCVLVALRDAIRRREIYVERALRWRNPEGDLPGDFDAARTVHYAVIRQREDSSTPPSPPATPRSRAGRTPPARPWRRRGEPRADRPVPVPGLGHRDSRYR